MTNDRYSSRRSFKRGHRGGRSRTKKRFYEKPRLDPLLRKPFKKIGVPDPTPFRPDPFQLDALNGLKESDVLVTAPTGSGKTWIASQAIGQYLMKGLRVWYASPLKALSNSLYQEFSKEFGSDSCGILTGERKENVSAPVIVGTTEILRNQLYDSMYEGTSLRVDLVILDEAHYLGDHDRGVVWEEVLIYLPPRVRLLLLSATISNAEEICSWLSRNRGTHARVVRARERPVPLEMLFLFPDGLISPLSGKKGLTSKVKKFVASRTVRGRRRGSTKLRYGDVIRYLRAFDLLPAIFFLKSRMDCDKAVFSCPSTERPHEFKEQLKREVRSFLRDYPHLEGHRQMKPLLESMVVSHHAGQLPYWKVFIERMMKKGYLEAIFSTSTVAAGVNFPARTVVLVQSDRYNGHEFTDLTATDLHQMIGRAGRRGKDNIGFALVIPGLHQNPQLIFELKDSPPEPLMSQIRINFSMTLNLLLSHRPSEVKEMLDRSFAAYQQGGAESSIKNRWDNLLRSLKKMLPAGGCDTSDPYELLENIRKRAELRKAGRGILHPIHHKHLRTYLEPGRLFQHRGKGVFVVFQTYMGHGMLMCRAHNIEKQIRIGKGRITLRKIPFDKIRLIFDHRIDLPEEYSLEEMQDLFDAVNVNELKVLDLHSSDDPGGTERRRRSEHRPVGLPCEDCEHLKDCHRKKNKELHRTLREISSLAKKMEVLREGLWLSFKRHLRFLKEIKFVDENDRLASDGIWASKLRLDQPLLIAEAIKNGAYNNLSPELMAGCIAPFIWERDLEPELRIGDPKGLKPVEAAYNRLLESIEAIIELKVRRSFESPLILFWPASALFLWAKGTPWEQLLFQVPIEEGDMASMIVRTADHLRQVTNLRDTHPELASVAKKAINLILREPVFI